MVYILLAPGFEEMEALVPADLLRRAGIETKLIAVSDNPVPGSHGITVSGDGGLEEVDLDRAQVLVLPGGLTGVKNLGDSPAVERLVREARSRNIHVAAICAAPTLLGKWGLLEGKQAVCYPGMEDELTGAQLRRGAGVVADGTILTGQAAGVSFQFGKALIETLAGKEAADQVFQGICWPVPLSDGKQAED